MLRTRSDSITTQTTRDIELDEVALSVEELMVRSPMCALVGPVSFQLRTGEILGVQGPSGCGKSTILRSIVNVLPPELKATGRVRLLGREVLSGATDWPSLRAKAVLVGQTPVVFPQSVLANALFGLRHHARLSKPALADRARVALQEAGLWEEVSHRLHAPAGELSVGQRHRLCIARALALDPVLLLLDEPTSALDAAATATVEATISSIGRHRSVLVVSHDSGQLERLCDAGVVRLPPPCCPVDS